MFKRPRLLPAILMLALASTCFAAKPSKTANEAQLHFDKAISLQKAGKLDAAMSEYRAVNKLAPKFTPALLNMGSIYMRENQPANAESTLKRVLDIEPKNTIALQQLAMICASRGRNRDALKYAQDLVNLKPKDYDARFFYGVLSLQMKDYQAAIDAFQAASGIRPKDTGRPLQCRLHVSSNESV